MACMDRDVIYICTPIDANPILPIQAARVVIKWGFNKANVTCWNIAATCKPVVIRYKIENLLQWPTPGRILYW